MDGVTPSTFEQADGGATAAPSNSPTVAPAVPCRVSQTNVAGITVAISGSTCTFTPGQAGTFAIALVVDSAVGPVTIPGVAWNSGPPPTDGTLSTLLDWRVDPLPPAELPFYCADCDLGLGDGYPDMIVVAQQGSFDESVAWPGREWAGPSDTDDPLGPAFPAGSYKVDVMLRGTSIVLASMPIEVVDP